jgi:hypothetical protein
MTITDDMVERAAKGIVASFGIRPDAAYWHGEPRWKRWVVQARAALEAALNGQTKEGSDD